MEHLIFFYQRNNKTRLTKGVVDLPSIPFFNQSRSQQDIERKLVFQKSKINGNNPILY